jgi:hypothetical protein
MTFVRPFRLNLGDGSDGVVALSGTVSKQLYQLADGSSISGLTLSSSYKPVLILCDGTLTFSGAMQGNGCGYDGGPAAVERDKRGNSGYGFRPGRAGEEASNGSHALTSPLTNFLDWLFGGVLLEIAGAGGGSGGGGNGGGGTPYGGKGGDGGGAAYVVCRRAVFEATAAITLNGEAGQQLTTRGGSGTGGVLGVAAEYIEFASSGNLISAVGASGAADGRIILAYLRSISGDPAARCNPDPVVVDLSKHKTPIG